jgi:hypothetical protein
MLIEIGVTSVICLKMGSAQIQDAQTTRET